MDSPSTSTPAPSRSRAILIAWALLGVAIVGAWANAVPGGPIFDDFFLVVNQQCFRTFAGLMRIFEFDSAYSCTYRPTRYFSYGLDHALFGGAFWGFHVGNILNHLVAVAMAAGLCRELGRRAPKTATPVHWLVFFVVALWALHPVQTDSVSYVSGRRDILAGTWTFASVWAALVADRRGGLWWLMPLWTTLIAFLSKESAVVVPALFLMWKVREVHLRTWLREHLATAIAGIVGLSLSFLMVLYRGVFESQSNRHFAWWGGSIFSNFATVAVLQVRYLRHVFLAHPLIGDYKAETIPLATSFADPRALLGVGLVVVLLAIAWATRKTRPLIAYGIGWYLICLAPVSHFFPHHELFAEHYLYIPLLGILLAVVDAACWGIERARIPERWQRIGVFAAAAILAVMALKVSVRNRDFASEQAFYERVVEHAPNNLRAAANLGNIYFDQGDDARAIYWLGRLAPLWTPGSGDELTHVRRLLMAAVRSGDLDTARAAADQLATDHPDVGVGHRYRATLAHNLGDYGVAFASGMEWWRTTRAPEALDGAMSAWHSAAPSGAVGPDEAEALRSALEDARDPALLTVRGVAEALRISGRPDDALTLLRAHRPPSGDAELDREACALARSLDTPIALPYCAVDAPPPTE